MDLYSSIHAQIESELHNPNEACAVSAYYTVVSHRVLGNFPIISSIEKSINENKDMELTDIDNELAVAILVESRVHELEAGGLVTVSRNGEDTIINLTEKGKKESLRLGEDIRKMDM